MFQGLIGYSENGDAHFQAAPIVIQQQQFVPPLARHEHDDLLIAKYQAACEGTDRAFTIEARGNRPDFRILRKGRSIGLDVTVFTIPLQRLRHIRFSRFLDNLDKAIIHGEYNHCNGIQITVDFDTEKIPEDIDAKSVADFVAATRWVGIQADAIHVVAQRMRHSDAFFHIGGQCGPVIWNLTGVWRSKTGARTPTRAREILKDVGIRFDKITEEINRLVAKHDSSAEQGIDELVVVAGAPDESGRMYVTEALIGSIAGPEKIPAINKPRFKSAVVLLNYQHSEVKELYSDTTYNCTGGSNMQPRV